MRDTGDDLICVLESPLPECEKPSSPHFHPAELNIHIGYQNLQLHKFLDIIFYTYCPVQFLSQFLQYGIGECWKGSDHILLHLPRQFAIDLDLCFRYGQAHVPFIVPASIFFKGGDHLVVSVWADIDPHRIPFPGGEYFPWRPPLGGSLLVGLDEIVLLKHLQMFHDRLLAYVKLF